MQLSYNISLAIALVFNFLSIPPILAQSTQPIPSKSLPTHNPLAQTITFNAPPPPEDIGEPGHRSDAGSRGCNTGIENVAAANQPLTAIVPVHQTANWETVLGLTTVANPTLWFDLPQLKSSLPGKLVIRDQAENLLYETDIKLPQQGGLFHVSIPSTAISLEANKSYHWYFKIYCDSNQPPMFVDGWIQRRPLSPSVQDKLANMSPRNRLEFYASHGYWHEAFAIALKLHRQNPHDPNLVALLQAVNLLDILKPAR
ncbi:MAG: DUF928 domain-containing protein [Waterburya sp.]